MLILTNYFYCPNKNHFYYNRWELTDLEFVFLFISEYYFWGNKTKFLFKYRSIIYESKITIVIFFQNYLSFLFIIWLMPILFVTGIIVNLQMFGNEITHICSMKFYFLIWPPIFVLDERPSPSKTLDQSLLMVLKPKHP
jgi:hypothetical protein